MAQILSIPFGRGSDGDYVPGSSADQTQTRATCTGTSGTTSLSATGSFSAGQLIFIHQTRGTGAGQWELNRVASYGGGTITTQLQLSYTYASGAQVIVVPEYSSVTINNAIQISAPAWDGSTGGWLVFACEGLFKINSGGSIWSSGRGFRGGLGGSDYGLNTTGQQGESSVGAGSQSYTANGNGGGGANRRETNEQGHGGAGGAHATDGTDGQQSGTGTWVNEYGRKGVAGTPTNDATLVSMTFGGAGGGGGIGDTSGQQAYGDGGNSAGGIFIIAKEFVCEGSVTLAGANGVNGSADQGSGGGGAGGPFLGKFKKATLGTNLITAPGGSGGTGVASGGNGSVGRIRIEAGTITGTTNPTFSQLLGGIKYLGALGPSA